MLFNDRALAPVARRFHIQEWTKTMLWTGMEKAPIWIRYVTTSPTEITRDRANSLQDPYLDLPVSRPQGRSRSSRLYPHQETPRQYPQAPTAHNENADSWQQPQGGQYEARPEDTHPHPLVRSRSRGGMLYHCGRSLGARLGWDEITSLHQAGTFLSFRAQNDRSTGSSAGRVHG